MRTSIFSTPNAFLHPQLPRYPRWNMSSIKASKSCIENKKYHLSAEDFSIPLKESLRARNFREYDNTLEYRVVQNDGESQSLVWMTAARNIFHQELTQMPEEYITRLVFNEHHKTILMLNNGVVYGGICFRVFQEKDFAEIAFCAVSSREQIRGYGSHVMAHVKHYLQAIGIHNILTYADNTAIGYFKRQGFTLELKLDPNIWARCIKDYRGATLIHCELREDIDYLRINDVVGEQKRFVSSLLPKLDIIKVDKWPVNMIKGIPIENEPKVDILNQMHLILDKIKINSRSWPFLLPVSLEDAPNYKEIIKNPMDLSTVEKNINNMRYKTLEDFKKDINLIFTNCYEYNAVDSVYYRSAKELESYFNQLLIEYKVGRKR